MIIKNADVLLGDYKFSKTDIEFGEKIKAIGDVKDSGETIDLSGYYVIPGLCDIHTHGAVDVENGRISFFQKV